MGQRGRCVFKTLSLLMSSGEQSLCGCCFLRFFFCIFLLLKRKRVVYSCVCMHNGIKIKTDTTPPPPDTDINLVMVAAALVINKWSCNKTPISNIIKPQSLTFMRLLYFGLGGGDWQARQEGGIIVLLDSTTRGQS